MCERTAKKDVADARHPPGLTRQAESHDIGPLRHETQPLALHL